MHWQAQILQLLCQALLVRLTGLAGPSARPVPELAGVPMVANRTVAAPRLPLTLALALALALAMAMAMAMAMVWLVLAMAAAVLTLEPPVQVAVVALAEVVEVVVVVWMRRGLPLAEGGALQ